MTFLGLISGSSESRWKGSTVSWTSGAPGQFILSAEGAFWLVDAWGTDSIYSLSSQTEKKKKHKVPMRTLNSPRCRRSEKLSIAEVNVSLSKSNSWVLDEELGHRIGLLAAFERLALVPRSITKTWVGESPLEPRGDRFLLGSFDSGDNPEWRSQTQHRRLSGGGIIPTTPSLFLSPQEMNATPPLVWYRRK